MDTPATARLVPYEQLDAAQLQLLDALEVHPRQKSFSGDIYTALHTLLKAPEPGIKGFALLAGETPVAFLLLKRPPFLPHWADPDTATLHALQVDRRVQGQGYGNACLQALPAAARQAWPDIRGLMLSVDADNEAAFALYLKHGWVDSGEAYMGRIGYERRLALMF
ncbi:GNAT family N-acetyltransferase [Pseudomonas chlororaphis]|uniref:GNAT family N-acetyltransferase n=1 Tax=Pseudomonas chlororaphis TaxID=587753 RepID=A0A1Q8ELK5_9PSED|nr:GNAT family N-acetyltransferase [Pseudomonas chlororaphis]OLF52681.1 GNAT family N-acetyltransferase [Pseudomonas chlororaphis]